MMLLRKDFVRYRGHVQISLWEIVKTYFAYPGFRFCVLRKICLSNSRFSPFGLLGRLFFSRMQRKYGFQIPFVTKIGHGFFMGHYGNIVINGKVTIGNDCNIAQGVTIGQSNRGKTKGVPVIGDRVWIGANAVIVGGIRIGNDVLIAPLSYVTEDIPDMAVVVGNPGKIISFNGSSGYINNIAE